MNELFSEKTFAITRTENGWILRKKNDKLIKQGFVIEYVFEDQPNDPDGFISYLQTIAKARPEYADKFNELCRFDK